MFAPTFAKKPSGKTGVAAGARWADRSATRSIRVAQDDRETAAVPRFEAQQNYRGFADVPVFSTGGPPLAPARFRTPGLRIQAKLRVGETNDPLEHEADRTAERVMRMADPAADEKVTMLPAKPQVSRKCAACELSGHKCASCQEEEQALQRKATSSFVPQSIEAPESVHNALRGPGRPLVAEARSFFEPRFGYNFGSVRIHTDADAVQSAREIGARAYTVGSNIILGQGENSTSADGKRLLAHELAHVVQQGAVGVRRAEHTRPVIADVLQRVSLRVQRQPLGCLKLLKAPGKSDAALGLAVQGAIVSNFSRRVGRPAKFSFPDASAAPSRTENPRKPTEIAPEIISFFSGKGHPDLAFRRPGSPVMLMAEIKPANVFGLAFAEGQIAKYIDKGNDNEKLKQELGVRVFAPMTPLTYTPPRTMQVMGKKVTVTWCGPGVIVYKAVEEEEEKKKKKKKKKDEKEEEKKKKKKGKKEEDEKEEKKKKKKKGDEEDEEEKKGGKEAGNVGFGIGILSSGSGGRNAVLGVAINSHGVAYGTASAGVVYDSNGNAVASATAGAGAHVSGNVAGAVSAGAGKDTSADAALSATAGTGKDTNAEALATASAGSAERTDTISVATASHGHAEDQEGTVVAKAGKGGEAGGGAGGKGSPGGNAGGGSGGLNIPGVSKEETQKAVQEAKEIDALLQKSSDKQKELLVYLAQTTGNMEYEVPNPAWVKTFLTVTSGLKPEDIAFLETQKWVPGEVSADELRRKIEERLKNRDKPQGDTAGKTPTSDKKSDEKPTTAPATGDTKDKGATAEIKKPDAAKDKIAAAGLDNQPSPEKPETTQEAYKRLLKRTKDFDWSSMHAVGEIIYGKAGKIYDQPTSGAFYFSDVVKGKRTRVTADVSGILTKAKDHDVFEIRNCSIVVTSDGRVGPGSMLVGIKIDMKR